MTSVDTYRTLTIEHLNKSTSGVYEWVEPTRSSYGVRRPVQRPTPTTYQNQINKKCADIESESNRLWRTICSNHMELDSRIEDLFIRSYSTLPTMYTLVKTHKFPPDTDYSRINLEDMKVRPIVSCCGSPTEKLAWLVTDIITHQSPVERSTYSHVRYLQPPGHPM